MSTAKKSKTTTFSRFFSPKKSTGNQSWIFRQKMKISNSVKVETTCWFQPIGFLFLLFLAALFHFSRSSGSTCLMTVNTMIRMMMITNGTPTVKATFFLKVQPPLSSFSFWNLLRVNAILGKTAFTYLTYARTSYRTHKHESTKSCGRGSTRAVHTPDTFILYYIVFRILIVNKRRSINTVPQLSISYPYSGSSSIKAFIQWISIIGCVFRRGLSSTTGWPHF